MLAAAGDAGAQAVALVGDLGDGGDGVGADGYRGLFRVLAGTRIPVYWVPGAGDAPVDQYLHEAHNIEVAFPRMHGVHGTAAYVSGEVLFAGMGGEISDDPEGPRSEDQRLRYPRWEPQYRLRLLGEFDYNELVLLFWTPPAHSDLNGDGSEVVTELVGTYRPRLVVSGGPRGVHEIGKSVMVAPGSLQDGHYAIAELRTRTVELRAF
jgi:Icc-related predicted phosphoesterase